MLARWYQATHYECTGCGKTGWLIERQLIGSLDSIPLTVVAGGEWNSHQFRCSSHKGGYNIVKSSQPVFLSRELFVWNERFVAM